MTNATKDFSTSTLYSLEKLVYEKDSVEMILLWQKLMTCLYEVNKS